MGAMLGRADKSIQWLIGDWYNGIPWGDKKAACERVDLNYATARRLRQCMPRHTKGQRRIANFGFHTQVAASLPTPEARAEVLERAAKEDWTVDQVRKEVKARKPKTESKPPARASRRRRTSPAKPPKAPQQRFAEKRAYTAAGLASESDQPLD